MGPEPVGGVGRKPELGPGSLEEARTLPSTLTVAQQLKESSAIGQEKTEGGSKKTRTLERGLTTLGKWAGIALAGVGAAAAFPVAVSVGGALMGLWGASVPLALIGAGILFAASKISGQSKQKDSPLDNACNNLLGWCVLPFLIFSCVLMVAGLVTKGSD